jgi:exocyst complex protein 7
MMTVYYSILNVVFPYDAIRFRSFNVLFEEIYQKQCGWSVPDSELRESLRLAVAEILLPAYRSFQKRFGYLS